MANARFAKTKKRVVNDVDMMRRWGNNWKKTPYVYAVAYGNPRAPNYDYFFADMTKLEVTGDQGEIHFSGVNAHDITDNLTLKIVSVNGVDVTKTTDYIRIIAQ